MGLVLVSPEKLTTEKSLRLSFSATNNEAEYETLLEGMSMVQRILGGGGGGRGESSKNVLGLKIGC